MATALKEKKKKKRVHKSKPIVRVNKARHMVITPIVRLSFPNLFVAKSFKDNPKEKKQFTCELIAESEDVWKEPYAGKNTTTVSLKKAIFNAKVDQFGPKEDWPEFEYEEILDGDDRTIGESEEVLDGYAGKSYIKLKSGEDYPPKVIHIKGGRELTDKEIWGGCLVRAQILVRPYDTGKNQGVSLRVLSIMKVDDGEKFGIGSGADYFDISEDDDDEGEDWSDESDDDEDDDI